MVMLQVSTSVAAETGQVCSPTHCCQCRERRLVTQTVLPGPYREGSLAAAQ